MKITFQTKIINRKNQLINIIRITLFAGAALWLFGGVDHTVNLYKYYGSENWPKVKVKIIESRISKYDRNIKTCSTPNIKYVYQYKGKQQISNKWGFSFFNCSSYKFAVNITSKFKAGTEAYAYVNQETGIAVLDADLSALWAVTFIGFSCCFLIWAIRPKHILK